MLEEWRATTDRSLANTETILRSLEPGRTFRKAHDFSSPAPTPSFLLPQPSTSGLDSLMSAGGGDAADYYYRLHKVSLNSEFDRFMGDIKAELDVRGLQAQKGQDGMKNEIRQDVQGQLGSAQEEIRELKQLFADEREKRVKLDKQVGALLRWQDEVRFGFDDLKRKVDELEEARSTDRREIRKELTNRSDDAQAAQAEARKEIDYLRALVAGKGSGKDSLSTYETLKSLESGLSNMADRIDKVELEMRRRTAGGVSGSDVWSKSDSDARLAKVVLLQDQLDSMQAVEGHVTAVRRDVTALQVDADRLHQQVSHITSALRQQEAQTVDTRKTISNLTERVSAAEDRIGQESHLRQKAANSADKAQATMQEVVQVIGAMSQRIAQHNLPMAGVEGGAVKQEVDSVRDRVRELQTVYEARFKDISVMLRHLGMSVRSQQQAKAASTAAGTTEDSESHDVTTDDARGGSGGRISSVTQTLFDEIKRVRGELGSEVDGVRAILAQQALAPDSAQLQEVVDHLVMDMGAVKRQLQQMNKDLRLLESRVQSSVGAGVERAQPGGTPVSALETSVRQLLNTHGRLASSPAQRGPAGGGSMTERVISGLEKALGHSKGADSTKSSPARATSKGPSEETGSSMREERVPSSGGRSAMEVSDLVRSRKGHAQELASPPAGSPARERLVQEVGGNSMGLPRSVQQAQAAALAAALDLNVSATDDTEDDGEHVGERFNFG